MKSFHNWNENGTIRAEIVIGHRLTPIERLTDLMEWDFLKFFTWEKNKLRGLIFDTQYINDDGQKCDDQGNPVEDKNFRPVPEKHPYAWRQHIYVSKSDQTLALSTAEYNNLIRCCPNEHLNMVQSDFRAVKCMELRPKENGPYADLNQPVYIGEESIFTLQQMVFEDIQCGDINARYRYECQYNDEFAKKYGTTVKAGLAKYRDDAYTFHPERTNHHPIFGCAPIICIHGSDKSDDKHSDNVE